MVEAALIAHDVVRVLGDRRVLDGISLTAAPGRRIGLIGENGVGKSTLLRVLAGVDRPDRGSVQRPPDLGYLRQEMPFHSESTVSGVIDDALADVREDLAEIDRLSGLLADAPDDGDLLAEYAESLERAQRHEAWDADRRAEMVLTGLGLGSVAHDRALASLSGGQRGRLALAALVVRRPSALLLDEPTNHLDDDAAEFLEEQLRSQPGTVVLASHDRAFLDAVCTDLIDLDPAVDGPARYGGGYSDYLAQRRAERERWQRRYAEEQEEIAALRDSLGVTTHQVAPNRAKRDNEKMGYGHRAGRVQNQIARRVRNAARRLEELERHQVPAPPQPLRFRPDSLAEHAEGELLVALRDVHVPGRLSVGHLDVSVTERLLVTGPNGAGKSTLLLVLAGRLDQEGVRWRPGIRVGLLGQDTEFDQPGRTARATYEAAVGAARAETVPLGSLGLLPERDLDRPVGELSVGQRRRLALALLVARPPHLLLLDEPTNHLSPSLCDELEDALGPGPGAIVVASHDRWMRTRWRGVEVRVDSGRLLDANPVAGQQEFVMRLIQ
ncbi:ABC-F family ATP-binding cassette domain-containing protein [Saccharopolyspora elongata]|uniref:ABC-F family ATP-binding cassette domain-containing protein n=1 Tax=Saccharopolyspora elongata TaxID=2530387 RepID=A0A4R4ZBD6_9PSEU|nr:ABC-F family ATP-binding cassette domain-containing protein [Saccharopolyspora elongata]TDD55150.1 ABC-F family ATP-binding cassette domain-containing protein [Saccharopolyspora elongata]